MRRWLLTELPLLTRFYGLTPTDVDHMTIREIAEYRSRIQEFRSQGGDPWLVPAG